MVRKPLLKPSLALVLGLAVSCQNAEQRAKERQQAIEDARAALKKAQGEPTPPAAAPDSPPAAALGAPWEGSDFVPIKPDAPCPEEVRALFGKERDAAAKGRATTFLVLLRAGTGVTVHPYDAPRGVIPIETATTVSCSDSGGRITIAWAPAKAAQPPSSAAQEGAEVQQNVWTAPPMVFDHPLRAQADARTFEEKKAFGTVARVVLRVKGTRVDQRRFKTTRQTSGDLSTGGGWEDWGAGRLVEADLVGVRVAVDQERTALAERRGR